MPSRHIHVTGIVQGVGFRPFVYNLAQSHHLNGEVRNTSAGVDIVVEGEGHALNLFVNALRLNPPPLAHIDAVEVQETQANGYTHFDICDSVEQGGAVQPIPPDIALCADCERELFDPSDRRYLYPFINCTACGPRYTIIQQLPYDRPATTMASFNLCAACSTEYRNPANRRFHAQPVACPTCGPQLELVSARQTITRDQHQALLMTRRLLREGKIVAIKGLGGFHLACDATNPQAVAELRRRKARPHKPLAIMLANLTIVEKYCEISADEKTLLTSPAHPIVLLHPRSGTDLAFNVAPGVGAFGVMLPYTPLHHLLLNQTDPVLAAEPAPAALVMTSGNVSDEPIAINNVTALKLLAPLADAFLLNNRDIHMRCDDSLVRLVSAPQSSTPLFMRRARGYAPTPIQLPFQVPPTLAVGGELKNTFCLAQDQAAYLSPHIGDLENMEALTAFKQTVGHLSDLFHIQPQLIAHDLHPDYASTAWARQHRALGQRLVPVQHHHAHIASVLADNGWNGPRPVIGLAFDGTGYGLDGAIWGCEFLIANYARFRRAAHLEYLPLPGGDAATRNPWRIALAYALALGLPVDDLPFIAAIDPKARELIRNIVRRKINTPSTSSLGRLFDAVAALINLRGEVTYEGQAATELEAIALPELGSSEPYPYELETVEGQLIIRVRRLLAALINDARSNTSAARVAARFHRTIANASIEVCHRLRAQTGLTEVALSGGVWQNISLLQLIQTELLESGFTVYTHHQVPPNDGGLALGQMAVAAALWGPQLSGSTA